MLFSPQNLIKNPNHSLYLFSPNTTRILNSLKTHNPSFSISPKDLTFPTQFLSLPTFFHKPSHTHHFIPKAFDNQEDLITENNEKYINLDSLLPVLEFVCIACSIGISIGLALNKSFFLRFGNRVFGWQLGFLVGAVAIGTVIRERQWRRVCIFSKRGSEIVNLVERIEKLEEDVKSSTIIVRFLSRQLEKLGVRFRVTRKTLKDPIAEFNTKLIIDNLGAIHFFEVPRERFSALIQLELKRRAREYVTANAQKKKASALAQKNSEATRALAAQEEILEKELSEIQKVLLLMQEQQQKQLELILAIAKTGKLRDTKQGPTQEQQQKTIGTQKLNEGRPNQMIKPHIQALGLQKESNNDKP